MKVLIVYSSKYGAATWAAEEMKKNLEQSGEAECSLVNIRNQTPPSPDNYDGIILGSSVFAGQVNKKIITWGENHTAELKKKPLGLFVTCLASGETAIGYIESNFPPALLAHAKAKDSTGGLADFATFGWLDRFLLKNVAKLTETTDSRDPDRVKEFVQKFIQ